MLLVCSYSKMEVFIFTLPLPSTCLIMIPKLGDMYSSMEQGNSDRIIVKQYSQHSQEKYTGCDHLDTLKIQ